jgi:cytochrome P450
LGNGIFLSDGADWEAQHKMLKTLFGKEGLDKTHQEIYLQTQILISDWKKQCEKDKKVDVETSIHFLMLKILFKTYFIKDDAYNVKKVFDIFQSIMKTASFKESIKGFFKIGLRWLLGLKKKENIALKKIEELDILIKELYNNLQATPNKRGMLTELLLQKLNNHEIAYKDFRDTVMNFIFAGFETTAAAITWSLHCLAKHQHLQKNIQEHLIEIHKQQSQSWQEIDVPSLTNFTKEAMRLYPPVWFYIRESIEDDSIDGHFIPKGSFIFICPFALHQNKDNWQQPKDFNPNRFLKENIQGKTYQYIPFGQGKRMCLGHALAGIQMHIILAELLIHFNFKLVSKKEPAINPAIIIKGEKPIILSVSKVI